MEIFDHALKDCMCYGAVIGWMYVKDIPFKATTGFWGGECRLASQYHTQHAAFWLANVLSTRMCACTMSRKWPSADFVETKLHRACTWVVGRL